MAPRRNRPTNGWGRNPTLELVTTAVVVLAVIGMLVVFLFVYHDLPFRVSTP
jgi:heme/copper-type cytochrome/quinol oxidase subunit 2